MTSTSSEPGFEATFTRIVRDEFISHARVPLLPAEEAQYTLVGHIHTIWTDPQSYSFLEQPVHGNLVTYEETNRRRLRLRVDVSLVERATGRVVWREEAMETRASYEVSGDPLVNQRNKMEALERIAMRLAQRMYMRTMERF
jgi:DNA repair exonuclease SbcCD nuclease subunit